MKLWHESMLNKLISYFDQNEDVLGLLLFGSLSKANFQSDFWSDIDILVVVKDNKLGQFFPAVEWMNILGSLYTYNQSSNEFTYTTRICFDNFNRVDFIFATEENLSRVNEWKSIPFFSGIKVIFSRSPIIDQIANQQYVQQKTPSVTEAQFLEIVRDFRFKSMLAVYKVVRDDLLIALHLTQDLIRDCCVLGMMLRDRETGTNVHKEGGRWNQLVEDLEITQHPFTSLGILDSIKGSNLVFEKLACEWSSDYREERDLLFDWIEKAEDDLRS